MLVYSAFLPYPPIKPDNEEQDNIFSKTLIAAKQVEQHLYSSYPDVIFYISLDSNNIDDHISINFAENLKMDLSKLGDFNEYKVFKNDIKVSQLLKEYTLSNNEHVNSVTDEKLSYSESIASHLLLTRIKPRIVSIKIGLNSRNEHLLFGEKIINIIEESNDRIAIIGLGNLSHCLTKESPFGYKKEGVTYDETMVLAIETNDIKSILDVDDKIVKNAKESALYPLLVVLGALKDKKFQSKILSYEHPLGVGYMVCEFILK